MQTEIQVLMINRKAYLFLREFFTNEKRALLVTGARQVGKTFAIRKIGSEIFEHVVEINFLEQPDAVELFSRPKSAEEILMRISAFTSKQLVPGKTLIFFDEVQECDEMVTAIKFLVDEGSYRYVMSGSLLGLVHEGIDDLLRLSISFIYKRDPYNTALTLGHELETEDHNGNEAQYYDEAFLP